MTSCIKCGWPLAEDGRTCTYQACGYDNLEVEIQRLQKAIKEMEAQHSIELAVERERASQAEAEADRLRQENQRLETRIAELRFLCEIEDRDVPA